MDCVEGKKKTKKTLLVLTERKSRREIIRPMRDQTARSVVRVLDNPERECGANFSKIFRTITVDNGSEFADCAGMEKSCRRKGNRTKIYYCHPYSSYERGSNENVNKMIRRWFPKGTDFRKVTAKAIQKVEDWINNYPVKYWDSEPPKKFSRKASRALFEIFYEFLQFSLDFFIFSFFNFILQSACR